MAQVKVSGTIPRAEHKRLTEIAAKHETTIGVIVSEATQEFVRNFKPAHAARLKRDKRRKEEEN